MPTSLYVQLPRAVEANSRGLVYFRYPLSENFDALHKSFVDSIKFAVFAIVRDKDGVKHIKQLGSTAPFGDRPLRQNGSQPHKHPDQIFFTDERNMEHVNRDLDRIAEDASIERFEIHSSKFPCSADHNRGCREFLQNHVEKYLRLKDFNLNKSDVWIIIHRGDIHDFDIATNSYSKMRNKAGEDGKIGKALLANACRLESIGNDVNHNPENGVIRCLGTKNEVITKHSMFLNDHSPLYQEVVKFQEIVMSCRRDKRPLPEETLNKLRYKI